MYYVVLVPFRGYGDTERPPNKDDYTLSKLTQDIVELVGLPTYCTCTCTCVLVDACVARASDVIVSLERSLAK